MKKIFILFTLILFLGGCSDYKEVNEMAIISGIGLDYNENGFAVTLEVLNEKVDKKDGKISTYTRTAQDKSIAIALEKAADLLSHRAYYSHIKLVVISESVAKNHLQEIADFFIRSTYLRENFNIVVSKDISPEDVFLAKTEENPIASSSIITLLQTNAFASDYTIDKKFHIILQEILDFGKDTSLSVINAVDNNFFIDGMAVFDEYKMIDIFSNEDAILYNILRNEIRKPLFNLYYEGDSFAIALYDIKSKIGVTKDEIKVDAVYRAKIMNNGPNFDIKNAEVLTALDEDFSKLLNEKLEAFIRKTQEANTDFLGLAHAYYVKSRDKNDELWQHAKISTNVKVVINKKGLVYSIYENN